MGPVPVCAEQHMCLRPAPVLRTVPQYQSQLCSGSGTRVTWHTRGRWGERALLARRGLLFLCFNFINVDTHARLFSCTGGSCQSSQDCNMYPCFRMRKRVMQDSHFYFLNHPQEDS